MSTYVIGDLQGCFAPFQRLLHEIDFSSGRDSLWFTGDIVNRGPDSEKCLRYVYEHQDYCQIVLGNHDLALLCQSEGFAKPHPQDTMDSILAAPDRAILLGWLRAQPLAITNNDKTIVLTHAGIWPQWDLEDALSAAQLLSDRLTSPEWKSLLSCLYGDTPICDDKSLTINERCRFICNALTRMRYCDVAGNLLFNCKSHPRSAPASAVPWYSHPKRRSIEALCLFGHWAALGGECPAQDVHAIDTGCVWGGELTAFRLEDQQRISVQSPYTGGEQNG